MTAAATFEMHRRHLTGLAYRMLGSVAEAEDVVQDAYLRWAGADTAAVAEPRGYLTTIVTRLCLDQMKSARARRETYIGPWLPEPVVEPDHAPDRALQLAEDLSIALLLTLERLSPLERAAFLLHDVFEVEFDAVAGMLDRTPAACRQLAARARRQVQQSKSRFPADADTARRLVAAFKGAAEQGDIAALGGLLAEDVVLYSDGGGKRQAALNPIRGRDSFLRFQIGLAAKKPAVREQRYEMAVVNGRPGLLVREADGGRFAIGFDTDDRQITAVYVVLNPDKLGRLPA